ncbi:class I SAM-dependent methyltransferase, partial [Salmonella enterica subsp. enterica]|nr:class I SAM-dependent methyltransferase [Salmonella enterica subsp. enterica serovar Abony]
MTDFLTSNQAAWDKQAEQQQAWSTPVSAELIAAAKQGNWDVHLTPQPLPKTWLGDVKGKRILCLASAGGQQAPVLAAAGADVTVFDLSDKQLEHDRQVAQRDGLTLQAVQGDMRDLSAFADGTFDC